MLLVFKCVEFCLFFFFNNKSEYEMLISDWSSDVFSSDLTFVLALALVVAAVRSVSGLVGTTVAIALVVVTFWQTGLGHSALVALDAAPWHTPLSLAAFPLAAFHAALLSVPADESGGASCRERVCQYV